MKEEKEMNTSGEVGKDPSTQSIESPRPAPERLLLFIDLGRGFAKLDGIRSVITERRRFGWAGWWKCYDALIVTYDNEPDNEHEFIYASQGERDAAYFALAECLLPPTSALSGELARND